jgi:ppGpp synthetase/RelA/SpoT-type nucleotidyltranferase
MDLIEDFIARYRKEYDFYDQAARLVAQSLDAALQSAGIRAIVTSRAKSPSRLEDKIRQRDKTKHYKNIEEIYLDRVALYFPGERDQVEKLVRELFTPIAPRKEFPGEATPTYAKRFSGYWATHYRLRLRESTLNDAQRRYVDAVVEVQVASVLMHAWAEVEHDLVYKPLEGRLSDEEYAILDELNGLVIAGEIALERLQKAGEVRVAALGHTFANHYELAAYLLDKAGSILKGPASESSLGRVDLLQALLEKLDLVTPEKLERYISVLSSDTERRPLAEQIVDQLLAEDESRYKLYEEIKTTKDRTPWKGQEKIIDSEAVKPIGVFLSKWIELERLVRHIVEIRTGKSAGVLPPMRLLGSLQVSNARTRSELESIRRLRNNLVHGIEVPEPPILLEAAQRLEQILAELRKTLDS